MTDVKWSIQVRRSEKRWLTLDQAKDLTDQQQIESERKKAAMIWGEKNVQVVSSFEGKR